MKHWMEHLALHYKKMRSMYPDGKLMICFDIDGTILDMRFIILHVLKDFDRGHRTEYFKNVKVSDIDFHEAHLKIFLNRLSIKEEDQRYILSYYENMFLDALTIKRANRPFRGVFDIIRWFQMQPNTYVGLNTGRPESLRLKTLSALNFLGKEFHVQFTNSLLFMNNIGLDGDIPRIKRMGIEYFQNLGFVVFAFVDNEPENLKAVADMDHKGEILLLHANTIFKSSKTHIKENFASGNEYEIKRIISLEDYMKKDELPRTA